MPIKIQVRGKPAVDTGGVLTQVFTELFVAFSQGTAPFCLFTGPDDRLICVYSSEHILTGVFEILGNVIAHSTIQGRPGFPYLAPSIFSYVATGDLREAVARSLFFIYQMLSLQEWLQWSVWYIRLLSLNNSSYSHGLIREGACYFNVNFSL